LNLLLDTHIAIWAVVDDPRLSERARDLLLDPAAQLHVSVVSLWEIAIKFALQRGADPMPISAAEARQHFQASGFVLVPMTAPHILALETLARHHDDPFDRLMVATALTEPFRLVTSDLRLGAYGPTVALV
jgi:PIN domain nuclease of toxin-antitoxin system